MTHTYQVTGMTCGSCEAKVKSTLMNVPHVTSVEVSKAQNSATIAMDSHVPLSALQMALGDGKYTITPIHRTEMTEQAESWLLAYKPVIVIFVYITGISLLVQSTNVSLDYMELMRHFMAGFFLVFSFFKMLDLKGFAESYAMYDIVAGRIPGWGYVYAFIEAVLGGAYLIDFNPIMINAATLIIMSISIIGVLLRLFSRLSDR